MNEATEMSVGSIPAADSSSTDAAPAREVRDRTTKPRLFKLTLAGRCANGFERDHGRVVHAVPSANPSGPGSDRKALCGAKPGRTSAGWSQYDSDAVTCQRCLSKMSPAR